MILLPNILFFSLLTNYRSLLTAHKVALPTDYGQKSPRTLVVEVFHNPHDLTHGPRCLVMSNNIVIFQPLPNL